MPQTSMGTDHDQIGRPLLRILDDRGTGRSHHRLDGFCLRLEPLFAGKANGLMQDSLTTLTKLLEQFTRTHQSMKTVGGPIIMHNVQHA